MRFDFDTSVYRNSYSFLSFKVFPHCKKGAADLSFYVTLGWVVVVCFTFCLFVKLSHGDQEVVVRATFCFHSCCFDFCWIFFLFDHLPCWWGFITFAFLNSVPIRMWPTLHSHNHQPENVNVLELFIWTVFLVAFSFILWGPYELGLFRCRNEIHLSLSLNYRMLLTQME